MTAPWNRQKQISISPIPSSAGVSGDSSTFDDGGGISSEGDLAAYTDTDEFRALMMQTTSSESCGAMPVNAALASLVSYANEGAAEAGTPYTGFTVRTWGEVLDVVVPPKKYILGDLFACGQVQVLFGQGGLGKSRLALNIARNQVLGIPFLGMTTGEGPMRHLFVGSENDIHRWKIDTACMTRGLTAEQRGQLADNIHMTTLEGEGDSFISLGDRENINKWRETLAHSKPDVLWVDPWGDVLTGDGFDPDVRATNAILRKLAGEVNPKCGIVVLAHARTGASNIAQATGFDAANFGKDSKALFSVCRSVVNLAPCDQSQTPDIVWAPAKHNNGVKLEPLRIRLDPDTMTYSAVGPLDVEAWQAEVKAHQKGGKVNKATVEFNTDAVLELAKTVRSLAELEGEIKKMGVSRRDGVAGIDGLIRTGSLQKIPAGTRNKQMIGTPLAIQNYQNYQAPLATLERLEK
ncbi:MAG: AAA family ATPase [bacterium]